MKPFASRFHLVCALALSALAGNTAPLGTAITYQGRLSDGTQPANGIFDLRFAVYDAVSGGGTVGSSITNAATPVANGLFTVSLDFGSGVFDGSARWLQIAVRTNGSGSFIPLAPRQALAPVPYAQYAPSAGASIVANTVPSGAITSAMLADGAVTSPKLGAGAVKLANIDDGGIAAYEQFLGPVKAMGTTVLLPFSGLSLVTSNSGAAPSLTFTLDGAAFGTVIGFTGCEAISEPYEFVVEVIHPRAELDPDAQMGRVGRVSFARNGRSTRFGGIVAGCSVSSYEGADALYTFRIESPLAFLALSTDYRVNQSISVPDVASLLYSTVTSYTLNKSLSQSYAPRASIIQYAETDLSFFSRLLEDEGIFYFFEQEGAPPALVLGDDSGAYLAAPFSPLRYYGNVATNVPAAGEFVRTFQKAAHESTRTATINAYDFQNPALNLNKSSSSSAGQGESYQFGSSANTATAINAQAGLRRQRHEVERATMFGTGNAPDLRPGHTFTLDDRTESGLGNSYLVTAIRHSAFRRTTNGVASLYYGNQFEVIPASMDYRPALKTPKPMAQACTANVTGPAGDTRAYTDASGRVKVQFHWDRYGVKNETSSGWIRLASPMAGSSHGMVFLPRPGDEVLVEFIQGDPDQPVIVGSLFNGRDMPPYALPAGRNISTIRSASTNDTLSEIRFDDTAGSEEMKITARNLSIVTSRGIGIGAGNDPAFALNIGGTVLASNFQGSGSALTNLPASALTGTLHEAQLPDYVARLDSDQTFSRVVAARVFAGSGAGLTNLPAASLTGTISDARLSGNVARLNTSPTFSGTMTASLFRGDGSGLTNLSTNALTGPINDAQIPANIPRLNADQVFSGANSFLSRIGVGGLVGSDALNVNGNARLNDSDLFLRGASDRNHGLGWYGYDKLFGGLNVDGPVLYGCAGGGLGTICSTPMLALAWNNAGTVVVDPHGINAGSYTPGLTFGAGSMEGIASRRTAGGNQYGLDFYTYGTNRLSLTQSGRVGIGTSVPTHLLHLNSPTTNTLRLTGPGANGSGAKINFGDAEYVYLHEVSDDLLRIQTTRAGVGRTPVGNRFEVEGEASKTTAGSWLANSDARIKTDLATITNALETLARVRPVSFHYSDAYRAAHPSIEDRPYLNVVAQEFREVFPDAVKSSGEKLADGSDILQVDTYPLTIYSAAAIHELNQKLENRSQESEVKSQKLEAENKELKQQLAELKALVESLAGKVNGGGR